MSADLLLAVDAGGASVKVAVFDWRKNLVHRVEAEVKTQYRANGWVEREGELFRSATADAIRAITRQVPAIPIAAAACTGFGSGVFLVDDQCRTTRPGIVSVWVWGGASLAA